MKPRARDLFPAARSSKPSWARRCVVKLKDISLAGRILANFPEKLTLRSEPTTNSPNRPRSDEARATYQAAQHLRLDPAAQDRDQGTARQGLQHSGLSDNRRDGSREGHQVSLRQGCSQAVNPVLREATPTAAPPAPSAYARKISAHNGAWSKRLQIACRVMSNGDYYGSEIRDTGPVGDQRPHRAGRRRRRRHGAEGENGA